MSTPVLEPPILSVTSDPYLLSQNTSPAIARNLLGIIGGIETDSLDNSACSCGSRFSVSNLPAMATVILSHDGPEGTMPTTVGDYLLGLHCGTCSESHSPQDLVTEMLSAYRDHGSSPAEEVADRRPVQ